MSSDLQWSIKNGDLDVVKNLVATEKIDVNKNLSGGRCPLHYAADMGQTDVIKYLIAQGADVDKKDVHGITPVLAAIWEGHVETVQCLLAAGASKKGTTPDGQSYIDAAEKAEIKALLK